MSDITTTLTSKELKRAIASFGTIDKEIAAEWRRKSKEKVARPWSVELANQAPSGRKGAAAARSIQVGSGALPVIWGGKGQWEGWQPFFALEFGMSHTKVHTYLRRNRSGRGRHVVHRRTGTWAPVHLGQTGHWFWPYWRTHEDHLRRRVVALFDDFVERELG